MRPSCSCSRALLPAALLALVAALAAGCGAEGERCAKCGMLVDDAPRWIAGVVTQTGESQRFCSPRCMFAWLRSPRGQGSRDPWVTEYYGQEKIAADAVLFVAGSNVVGPMGKSLVPVKGREAAERFLEDHRGTRILAADEITSEVLKEIAGRGGKSGQGPSR